MCTVTWTRNIAGDGYQLFCNRDEKFTRGRALPPVVGVQDGVRFLAPRDPDGGGGTWLSVNELGVTMCLLNGAGPAPARVRSRGSLVLALAGSRSPEHAASRVEAADLTQFAPFTLVAIGANVVVGIWNGVELRVTSQDADALLPVTSSSFDADGVCASRRAAFRGFVPHTPENLFDFHRSHGPAETPSAYSTCMHRDDAATVSFSWVTVAASEIRLTYSGAAPCQGAPGETYRLPRAKEGASA